MKEHTIDEFRKAVTAGTPVEAIARNYGLARGPGESERQLAARLEMLLKTRQPEMKAAYGRPKDVDIRKS